MVSAGASRTKFRISLAMSDNDCRKVWLYLFPRQSYQQRVQVQKRLYQSEVQKIITPTMRNIAKSIDTKTKSCSEIHMTLPTTPE